MSNDVELTDNEKLAVLKKWFMENPKLPDEIDDLLLKRFLRCVHGDIDETKKLIEHNYTLRHKHPHLFVDRNPSDEEIQEFFKIYDMIPLPGLTPEGHKVSIFRFNEKDPSKVNTMLECKTFHMLADCRFTMPDVVKRKTISKEKSEESKETEENKEDEDNEEFLDANDEIILDTANTDDDDDDDNDEANDDADDDFHLAVGDIQIIDMSNCTLSHMARASFFTMRIQMKFVQEAYPMRLCGSHMINCPTFLDRMVSFVRPFIKDEVFNMMRFHTNGIDSLYEHIPRDMMPNEYGGKAGTIPELKENWKKVLEEKRSYLTDPKYWKVEKTQNGRWSWW